MKKSRHIALLITSSLALSACDRKPRSNPSAYAPEGPLPTSTPTNKGSTNTSSGGHGGWWGWFGGRSSSGGGEESGSVSRGGFGGHASSSGE